MLTYNSADFFEFAAEAGLYKTHIKMCTTSFSAEIFYSTPTGIFARMNELRVASCELFNLLSVFSVPSVDKKSESEERKRKTIMLLGLGL